MKIYNGLYDKRLSSLESDILEILWKKKEIKVIEVYNILKKKRKIAHTSIAVMLDRLYKRKYVKRKIENCKGGFRYIYSPLHKKVEFERILVESTVNRLIKQFGNTAINYFDEKFGKGMK